ncbi:hypothetical protein Tco_0104181 [Tanacetum coccineum]
MSAITDIKCALTQKSLDAFCTKYHIPDEVHPVFPNQNDTMHERPVEKIRLYTRFFDYANFRLPLSVFLVDVLKHFRINISQLSVIGAAKNRWMSFSKRFDYPATCYTKPLDSLKNWNDHFFWVDDFACPASFPWHTSKNVTRDPAPVAADFNAQDYTTLVAHPSPVDMDIFALIHTPDPTKVKVVEREQKDDEPLLLQTTIGRTVPLLLVAPDQAESELEASVDKLFDEGGSGDQTEQGGFASSGRGVDIQLVSDAKDTVAEDAAHLQPKRQRKRKTVVVDAGESSHPPKRLREDHETPSGASVIFDGNQRFLLRLLVVREIILLAKLPVPFDHHFHPRQKVFANTVASQPHFSLTPCVQLEDGEDRRYVSTQLVVCKQQVLAATGCRIPSDILEVMRMEKVAGQAQVIHPKEVFISNFLMGVKEIHSEKSITISPTVGYDSIVLASRFQYGKPCWRRAPINGQYSVLYVPVGRKKKKEEKNKVEVI